MTDIGMNEGLEIRHGADGSFFILWPFGPGPQYGNVYRVETQPTPTGIRAFAPAMPDFIGHGRTPQEAENDLITNIRAYIYRIKQFLDVAQPLILRYIAPDPYHPGEDNVIIHPDGVSVWAIIGAMMASAPTEDHPGYFDRFIDDAVIRDTARSYGLPEEAVRAAVAYYYGHRPVIDARIQANDAAA